MLTQVGQPALLQILPLLLLVNVGLVAGAAAQTQADTARFVGKIGEAAGAYVTAAMMIDAYRARGCGDLYREAPTSQDVLREIKTNLPPALHGRLDAELPSMTADGRRVAAQLFDAAASKGIDNRATCGLSVGASWPLFKQARDDWRRIAPAARQLR